MKLEKYAVDVLNSEALAIKSLARKLGLADTRNAFRRIINLILNCKGRVVVSGMGKAGIIGQKISATLASTGTPSLFLHPAEAYHGDLGRVTKDDVVLTLSNSGETEEIVRLLPSLKKIGARIISITRSKKSMLGKYSDVVIETGYIKESCPIGVVPSASTTALLALGDAIALTVFNSRPLKDKSFAREQFAFYHPGGELGRQFLKVKEIMRTGKRNPVINSKKTVKEALLLITRSRAGAINIVDNKGKLAGIFTDGDLRRHISRHKMRDLHRKEGQEVLNAPLARVMTKNPKATSADKLVVEALQILRDKKIDELPVVDSKNRPVGMLDVQDILDAGL